MTSKLLSVAVASMVALASSNAFAEVKNAAKKKANTPVSAAQSAANLEASVAASDVPRPAPAKAQKIRTGGDESRPGHTGSTQDSDKAKVKSGGAVRSGAETLAGAVAATAAPAKAVKTEKPTPDETK